MSVARPDWMEENWIRPYVFMTSQNQRALGKPGSAYRFDWFDREPVVLEAQTVANLDFANQIMKVDSLVFGGAEMIMPRWVFYDCAVVPGMITGFAAERKNMPKYLEEVLQPPSNLEWVPLSLFIVIPTLEPRHWSAHNLSSVNEVLPRGKKLGGLGFLSKAFGLWYGNIQNLYGITQWGKPALKLHANYGDLELITAYTPIHTKPNSLTYQLRVNPKVWPGFFGEHPHNDEFRAAHVSAGFSVEPTNEESLRATQLRLEKGEGPFFLDGWEILEKKVTDPLTVFCPKN